MIDITRTITIFTLFLLSSCLVDQVPRNMRKAKVQYKTKKAGTPAFGATAEMYWYTSKNDGKIVSLDREKSSILYLRGRTVHEFLKYKTNSTKKYCVVADFTLPDTTKKQLRILAIPITFTNFSSQTLERLFRLDLKNKSSSEQICAGSLPFTENNIVSSTQISSSDSEFQPSDLCSDCSTLLSSLNISIYEENTAGNLTSSQKISKQKLSLLGMNLEILSPSMASKVGDSRCSNATCQARKFDCCLNNQCVNDGTVKPGASYLSDYQQALLDVEKNEMNFLFYPNIYYICPNFPRPISSKPSTGDDSNLEDAQAQLALDIKYYNCLLEGDKTTPDYATQCSATDSDFNLCSGMTDENCFKAIRGLVWKRCGCKADPFPTEPDNLLCPNYGLRPIKNLAGTVLRFECQVPSSDVSGSPFQELEIKLNGRTVPHRFYKADDPDEDAIDDLTTILSSSDTTTDQEGDSFFYQDTLGKTEPEMSPFSMNAVLGPINVLLDQAIPARVITVEYDRQYIISAIKGFYTPCPQCQKDAWLSSLSAYPFSQNGTGIQAAGYTTQRNSYQNNTSNGNYEDTIFGRACWVPPTMIPFGHKKNEALQTQRLNRLETQAAFFVNGYQRDWYGFNKGALIGSFDGISWFAIGNGRRITSTSTKLFLAFNSPFGDLSDPISTTVSIMVDLGSNSVAQFDYNPSLGIEHPQQNKGGTCRLYHQCTKDSDCVTKLGWEYVCSDVSQLKSRWPKFDKDAKETKNDQLEKAGFSTILSNFPPSGSSSKRCIYRGAGALCKRDYKKDLEPKYKKLFTCAPNFYCASLGDNVFNNKIMRTPSLYNPVLFGQQANVLGRPEKYVGATEVLTSTIQANIKDNASLYSTNTEDFGLCRPGKLLADTTTPYPKLSQHKSADSQKRTDYISQISSCDETKTGDDRVVNCPLFERNIKSINYGNYILDITSDSSSLISSDYNKELHYQNACGRESVYEDNSSFNLIEAKRIASLAFLEEETLAASACLRRAGSICHTNLDCVPNILHEKQALTLDKLYFGNTDAEHKYWQESLVCGQAQKPPHLTDSDYESYDMTLNKCCREVGKELTMYTQYKKESNDPELIPEQGTGSFDMSADAFSYKYPSTDGRYSRYGLVDLKNVEGTNDATPDAYNQLPIIETANNTPKTPRQFQWKTLHETGRRSCCGGGWIRKFADDTNDWTQNPRLNFDIAAFSCLNYQTPLSFYPPGSQTCNAGTNSSCLNAAQVSNKNYNKDIEKLCLSPANGGCLQVDIPSVLGYEMTYPGDASNDDATMDTTPTEAPVTGSPVIQAMTSETPYMPTPYANSTPIASSGPYNYFATRTFHDAVSFYLPIYIGGKENINSVTIKYVTDEKSFERSVTIDGSCPATPISDPKTELTVEHACIEDITSGYKVFHIRAKQDVSDDAGNSWNYAGVEINFNPMGTTLYKFDGTNNTVSDHTRLNSGNALYYLTKLSRFELSGIPQIFYEPLYCNTDRSKLVENLFDLTDHTRTNFEASTFSFEYDQNKNYSGGRSLGKVYYNDSSVSDQSADKSNPDGHVVMHDKILLGKVFSPHKFKCCLKLGEEAPSKESCCSNFTVSEKNSSGKTVEICKLPQGTDLNLYFNRFVSGEGYGKTLPAGGLEDKNYIPETGEPKLDQETFNKLDALGREYCQNKTIRRGAAFGYFYPEPNSGFFEQEQSPDESRKYSIIDSILDSDPINDTGTVKFLQGYRWNHHVYCK